VKVLRLKPDHGRTLDPAGPIRLINWNLRGKTKQLNACSKPAGGFEISRFGPGRSSKSAPVKVTGTDIAQPNFSGTAFLAGVGRLFGIYLASAFAPIVLKERPFRPLAPRPAASWIEMLAQTTAKEREPYCNAYNNKRLQ
jgi:hypothetical protein